MQRKAQETIMLDRFSGSMITVAMTATALGAVVLGSITLDVGPGSVAENALGRTRSAGHLDGRI